MRILCATDGSEGARIALDFLLALPLSAADEVRVVAVPVLRGLAVGVDSALAVGSIIETAFEAADELATRACERITQQGARAKAVVRGGLVTRVILEEAQRAGVDLIVVGSRGLGALRGVILGSTARWLAQHSAIPVLVVRERRVAPTRVLVAVEEAEDAHHVSNLLARLRLGDARVSVLPARDAGTILDAAGAGGADLIVLGSDRMSWHDGLFTTSVAGEILARAHCAVLLPGTATTRRTERARQITLA